MVRFGDFVIDVAARELRRGGQQVHLEPQAFDLLVVLLEHRDRVVSKTELLDGVWGHRFLSEANLTTRIKEVRRALGDDGARQHSIKNVRGRGYRFVAPVEGPGAMATTGLIGRGTEIEELSGVLQHESIVTIIGPGGVGKSTLARVVAQRAGPRYEGGVHLVELATLDRGANVLATVARALDIVFDGDRPQQALRPIAELDALLVLDNCEHVVDDVGDLLDRLMGIGGARIRVLATSQVRLGLSTEKVVKVDPLTTVEALDLFTIRTLAVRPSWTVDSVGSGRVSALLAALDQLPLTVEMAAARLGSMTFDELERAIGDGSPLPQMTHRSPTRRHRSLDSLVTWSAELLEEGERRTFTEFAAFAGPVTTADAAAVAAPERRASAMFDLASLAERSLLVADVDESATRYRMLATVRAVASRWLDESGTADDVRRRHAEHFAGAIRSVDRQIRGPEEADGRQRLDEIVAELRAAHRWAQQHDPALASEMSGALHMAVYSTFWNEPVEWSRALLAAHPDAAPTELEGARIVVAGAAASGGDLADARAAATVTARSTDPRVRAMSLEILADVAIYSGELGAVDGLAEALHRLGEQLDDPHSRAIAAVDVALALTFDDRPALALERLDGLDLLALSPSDRAWVAYTRGEALSAAGDPGAASTYTEAIDLSRSVGNPFVTSVSRVSLATEYARAGAIPQALDAFAECLHDYARHGNYVHAVTTLRNLVEVLVATGDDRGAAVLAAATSADILRPSYGAETARLSGLVTRLEQRAGTERFTAWTTEGQLLDIPQAVRVAAELVASHRA